MSFFFFSPPWTRQFIAKQFRWCSDFFFFFFFFFCLTYIYIIIYNSHMYKEKHFLIFFFFFFFFFLSLSFFFFFFFFFKISFLPISINLSKTKICRGGGSEQFFSPSSSPLYSILFFSSLLFKIEMTLIKIIEYKNDFFFLNLNKNTIEYIPISLSLSLPLTICR